VSKQIAALGLDATNSSEQTQAELVAEMKEMAYLVTIAVFFLICSAVVMADWRKISLLKHRQAWSMLKWMGLRERDIHRLFSIQSIVVSGLGAALDHCGRVFTLVSFG
jgi:predicted lysophospholipase L1 biosynthesis ABC-type transport system permease subunit